MMKMDLLESYISEKERQVLELIQGGKSLTEASSILHISKQTASMRLRALRERYQKAKNFVATYERERAKIPTKYL